MLILMKKNESCANAASPCKLAKMLFDDAVGVYNDQAADKEAYIHEPDGPDIAGELSLVDGAADPDAIREMARDWNAGLARVFDRTLAAALETIPDGEYPERWLGVPNPLVYDLKKAVLALDNDFYSFAEDALLVNRNRYFTARLQDDELADILEHPEDYASIDVAPK